MATVASLVVRIGADISNLRRGLTTAEGDVKRFDSNISKIGFSGAKAFGMVASSLAPISAVAIGVGGALSSAFASAGVGAVAFGSVAVGVLGDVFQASSDLKTINEQIAQAQASGDMERVNQLYKERANVMKGLSSEQKRALAGMQEFKSFWSGFIKQFETPVVDVFTGSLKGLQTIITTLKPAFEGSMNAMVNLTNSFNESLKAPDVQRFFNYLNESAGPTLETLGKAFGNVFRGILNLLTAFGPLGEDTAKGFGDMAKRFAEWSAGLANSKSFQNFVDYVRENGPKLWNIIKNVVSTLKNIVVALAPIGAKVLDVADGFFQFTSKLTENHPWITKVVAVVAMLVGGLSGLIAVFGPVVAGIGTMIGVFKKIKTAVTVLGGALKLLAANPVVLIIAAIAALVAIGIYLYKNWDEIKPKLIKVWETVKEKIGQAWQWLKDKASELWQKMKDAVVNKVEEMKASAVQKIEELKQGLSQRWNYIKTYAITMFKSMIADVLQKVTSFIASVKEKIDTMKTNLTNAWNYIKAYAVGRWKAMISEIIQKVVSFVNSVREKIEAFKQNLSQKWNEMKSKATQMWNNIKNAIINPIKSAKDNAVNRVRDMYNSMRDRFQSIWSSAKSKFNSIKNAIIDPITNARNKVRDALNSIKSYFSNLKGKLGISINKIKTPRFKLHNWSWNPSDWLKKMPRISVEWYKKGGVFDGASVIGVGEAGPEAVVPLRGSRMAPFAKEIARQMNGGSSGVTNNITINYQGSGSSREDIRELVDILSYELHKMSKIKNRPLGIN